MGKREECGCPPHTRSISQITAHDLCARRRAWDKVDGIPRQDTPSTLLGGEVHDAIENAIRHVRDQSQGAPLDLTTKAGQIALSAAHLWPRDWTELEGHFVVALPSTRQGRQPHLIHGFKDLERPGEVWDWKTTGDLKWAKSETDLLRDPQACLYSYDAMIKHGVDTIPVQWVYMTTRLPSRCQPSRATLTFEGIRETLRQISQSCDEILDYELQGKRALDLAPNPAACTAFGGCSYRTLCNLPVTQQLEGLFTMTQPTPQAMAAHVAALSAGLPSATPALPSGGAPAPSAAPMPPTSWGPAPEGYEWVYAPQDPSASAGFIAAPKAAPPAPPALPPPPAFNPPPMPQAPPPAPPPMAAAPPAAPMPPAPAPEAPKPRRGRPPKITPGDHEDPSASRRAILDAFAVYAEAVADSLGL